MSSVVSFCKDLGVVIKEVKIALDLKRRNFSSEWFFIEDIASYGCAIHSAIKEFRQCRFFVTDKGYFVMGTLVKNPIVDIPIVKATMLVDKNITPLLRIFILREELSQKIIPSKTEINSEKDGNKLRLFATQTGKMPHLDQTFIFHMEDGSGFFIAPTKYTGVYRHVKSFPEKKHHPACSMK